MAKMRLAPYVEEDEEKEVACLDTNLIPQLEEEQRDKIKAIFESQIAALREVLEKPRGTCGGANCPGRKEDPNDDGAAGKRTVPNPGGEARQMLTRLRWPWYPLPVQLWAEMLMGLH